MTESPSSQPGPAASDRDSADHRESAERGPAEREVVVRRAPSVIAFLITGLVLGLILAVISTVVGPADQKYTSGAIFGMMAVIFGTGGALLGAIVGLVADRISRRRAKRFRAIRVDEEPDAS